MVIWERIMQSRLSDPLRAQPELPFVPPLLRGPRARRLASDGAHVLLTGSLWLFGNALVVLGFAVVAVIALCQADAEFLFGHLKNLSVRFLAADAVRRDSFIDQVTAGYLLLVAALCAMRLSGFIDRVRKDLAQGKRP